MTEADVDAEWTALRARWPELFVLLDAVDLRLSPRRCAERLGFSTRDLFERQVRRRGLPRYRALRDWWYVAALHERARQSSLAALASARGDYPSVLYRFVAATTGMRWQDLAVLDCARVRETALRAWAGPLATFDPSRSSQSPM